MSALRKPVTIVERAVTHIITRHPFYASILLKRDLIAKDVPTAAITSRGQIYYNPAWFESMSLMEVVFVLCHECMHYMMSHATRRGKRPAGDWNTACDAVINEMQLATGVGIMPIATPGIRWPNAHLFNAEEVYVQMQQQGEFDKPKPEPGEGDGWSGEDIDDSEPMDEGERAVVEAEARVELRQAVDAAKRFGGMPAPLQRLVEVILTVPTPWYELFYQFFTLNTENDYTFAKFDRRSLHKSMYLPWFDGEGMGKVVIIVDVSGSIDITELNEFGGHTNKILDTCLPREVFVVFVHTKVCKVDTYTPDDFPVKFECDESGGTDMTAGIEWAMENHPDTDAIVVLTDGYTPFGTDCGVPTFWAITSDIESPWGQTVKLEVTQ